MSLPPGHRNASSDSVSECIFPLGCSDSASENLATVHPNVSSSSVSELFPSLGFSSSQIGFWCSLPVATSTSTLIFLFGNLGVCGLARRYCCVSNSDLWFPEIPRFSDHGRLNANEETNGNFLETRPITNSIKFVLGDFLTKTKCACCRDTWYHQTLGSRNWHRRCESEERMCIRTWSSHVWCVCNWFTCDFVCMFDKQFIIIISPQLWACRILKDVLQCATSTSLKFAKRMFEADISENMSFGACLPPEPQSSYRTAFACSHKAPGSRSELLRY